MKISDIQISRYGAWQDLKLSLPGDGLNVFYGPNEAGKTTLMRFVRGLLYGFPTANDQELNSNAAGGLTLDTQQGQVNIWRESQRGTRGRLSIDCGGPVREPEQFLDRLLSHTEEELFERVFAIGLYELQELATLEVDEVARHIHGLTLGPEGQRLLQLMSSLQQQIRQSDDQPQLQRLLREEQELSRALQQNTHGTGRHATLTLELKQRETEIATLEEQLRTTQHRIVSVKFLQRIWSPWRTMQDCREELNRLPYFRAFPENGLQKLDTIEKELTTARAYREAAQQEVERLQTELNGWSGDSQTSDSYAAALALVEQKPWIEEVQQRNETEREQTAKLKRNLDQHLAKLGKGWSANRLETLSLTPATLKKLLQSARKYLSALARKKRWRRDYDRRSESYNTRSSELAGELKKLGGQSPPQAIARAEDRLRQLRELSQLQLREQELLQQQHRLSQEVMLTSEKQVHQVPPWVTIVLIMFAVVGLILAFLGFYTGVKTSGISGLIYFLMGLTGAGMAWGLKSHYEGEVTETLTSLEHEVRETELRLEETREAMNRLQTMLGLKGKQYENWKEILETLTAREIQRLADARVLEERDARLQRQRRALSGMRSKFQDIQRDVNSRRQAWCAMLKQAGLPETVKVGEAFDASHQLTLAIEQLEAWKQAQGQSQRDQEQLQQIGHQIQRVGRDLGLKTTHDTQQPSKTLALWKAELGNWKPTNSNNAGPELHLLRQKQQEFTEYTELCEELLEQKYELLIQAGARNRDEFRERLEEWQLRKELEQELAQATEQYEKLCQGESALKPVHAELEQFEKNRATQQLQQLANELENLELQLQQAYEKVGSLKAELQGLHQVRDESRLRYDLEQVRTQLRTAMTQWTARQVAGQALTDVRANFERHQPSTLAIASRFLERMTCGKFHTLWSHLGEGRLFVEDDQHQSYTIEQLSGGTREQLFLAIRLAIVEEFSQRGVELPMVLDDVLVNFDQHRTEAVIDTLMEFADQGQQILLFTCHLHLAELIERKGLTSIHLPTRTPEFATRFVG